MSFLKYLTAILRFFNQNDYTYRENIATIISDIYERNPNITLSEFKKEIKLIRSDFFRINKINKSVFAESLFSILEETKKRQKEKITNFEVARDFISRKLEIGFEKTRHKEERDKLLERFGNVSKPHQKLIASLDSLLQKISQSYQIELHGVKEYSGVDLVKRIEHTLIGFQMKSINDDITEDKIRAQTSKALEYNLDGFVWIYGRPPSKDVDNSAQAAIHHFMRINETKKMYCAVAKPELLAELFVKNEVEF